MYVLVHMYVKICMHVCAHMYKVQRATSVLISQEPYTFFYIILISFMVYACMRACVRDCLPACLPALVGMWKSEDNLILSFHHVGHGD